MNTSELRAMIARTGITNRALAKELNISEQAFCNKIKGDTEFKSSEIKTLANTLRLSMADVNFIFFDSSVNQNHDNGIL